jgi:ribosomal RNA-processing protein 17
VVEKGEEGERGGKGKKWPKKEKKKKFRYESKAERKVTRGKQKAGNKARADARRGGD